MEVVVSIKISPVARATAPVSPTLFPVPPVKIDPFKVIPPEPLISTPLISSLAPV